MAVALQSNNNYTIVSREDQLNDKSVFHIKLTDSCLKSLEKYKKHCVKNGRTSTKASRPSIKFKGNNGTLLIPSKSSGTDENGTIFQFSRSSMFNEASTVGLDCFEQKRNDMGLILLGNIGEKITVSATNDSYQTTRNRMAEAENKRKGNSAKVIELSSNDGTKKTRRPTMPRTKNPFRKLKPNNKFNHSSNSSKTLREKTIHLLALKPLNKLELRLRLERDGAKLKDTSLLTKILQQVATMQENQYILHRHLYTEIQVDSWPAYTDEDREFIKNKLVSEMGTSVERLSPGILGLTTNNNTTKRPLSGGSNPAGKKQRIAHGNSTGMVKSSDGTKQPIDKSPPKIISRSTNDSSVHVKAKKEHARTNHKIPTNHDVPMTDVSNDNNNNNCSIADSITTDEDYFVKYPKITSYAQRCSYKEEFRQGYDEYMSVRDRLNLVSKKFVELREELERSTKESKEAKDINRKIIELYEEKKEEWTADKKKVTVLYPKLSHIKQLVMQYDQAQFDDDKTLKPNS